MSKPDLQSMFPNGSRDFFAKNAAQLNGTPKPRTVKIEVAESVPCKRAKSARLKLKSGEVGRFFSLFGVLAPEAEYKFVPDRRWRFDYAWPAQKIALEVEGGVWTNGRHTRGSGFVKDMQKYNRAAVLGWRVVRVVPSELRRAETAAMIRAMMEMAELRDSSDPRLA